MRSRAFTAAERTRRRQRPATLKQRRYLQSLARKAGVETPRVIWSSDATDAISRLERLLRQPALEGFAALESPRREAVGS